MIDMKNLSTLWGNTSVFIHNVSYCQALLGEPWEELHCHCKKLYLCIKFIEKIQKLFTPPILISRGEIRSKQRQWLTHRAH